MAEEYLNWGRSYRIEFGTAEITQSVYKFEGFGVLKTDSYPLTNKIAIKQGRDSLTIPSNALVMSNLEADGNNKRGFTFTLDSSRKSSAASSSSTEKTTIQLYNLNKEALDVLNQDNCIIRVYAGYQGRIDLAYTGEVVEVHPVQSGQDIVQMIKCTEGASDIKNTKGTVDYDEDMSEADMILDLASRFPATAIRYAGLNTLFEKFTTGGESFSGSLDGMFNKVMARNNLSYSRFNGKISIIPYSIEQASSDFLSLAANTYVLPTNTIKSILPKSKNGQKKSSEVKTKEAISVNTFFIPIETGQFFTIPFEASAQYEGTYLVDSVRTVLKSHGQEWDVVITGSPI